eukprot:2645079-Rhodomonas_salina.1
MAHIFDLVEAEVHGRRRQNATNEPVTEEQINAVLGPPRTDPTLSQWQHESILTVDLARCTPLEFIRAHRNETSKVLLS